MHSFNKVGITALTEVMDAENQNNSCDTAEQLPQSMSKMGCLSDVALFVSSDSVCLEQYGVLPALTWFTYTAHFSF